jgi:hypothetical protein
MRICGPRSVHRFRLGVRGAKRRIHRRSLRRPMAREVGGAVRLSGQPPVHHAQARYPTFPQVCEASSKAVRRRAIRHRPAGPGGSSARQTANIGRMSMPGESWRTISTSVPVRDRPRPSASARTPSRAPLAGRRAWPRDRPDARAARRSRRTLGHAAAAFAKPAGYELLNVEHIPSSIRLPADQGMQRRLGTCWRGPLPGRPGSPPGGGIGLTASMSSSPGRRHAGSARQWSVWDWLSRRSGRRPSRG